MREIAEVLEISQYYKEVFTHLLGEWLHYQSDEQHTPGVCVVCLHKCIFKGLGVDRELLRLRDAM